MNSTVYMLKVVDPENGKIIEIKTFSSPDRAFGYLMKKSKEDSSEYDYHIKKLGVVE